MQGVQGPAWHDLALGTPVTNLFLSFVRTKPLQASTQRPRTRPKVPTALMSLRLSSRKVGGHPSGLEGVDLGLWVFSPAWKAGHEPSAPLLHFWRPEFSQGL